MNTIILLCFLIAANICGFNNSIGKHSNYFQQNNLPLQARVVAGLYKKYDLKKSSLNQIYPFDGHPGDSTVRYKLDQDKLNLYFKSLKNTLPVSDIFISDLNQIYQDAGIQLSRTKQYDGPIDGLEYDLIYKIQEPDDIINHLNEMKVITIRNKNKSSFIVLGIGKHLRINACLSRYNDTWLIDHLTPYYL